ncbi:hypothetical protein CK203_098689 [Vitis vinifera]|uniref:Myb/SANT-like domain-containing protein n=1 Tax=Vitis vinifera TaxID=29760 RepID=A0A438DIJ6_VITVI|nr:hypothetical protein CK203_098689 [Vitis vinifera]
MASQIGCEETSLTISILNNDVFLCLSPDNDIIEATETSQIQSLSAQVQSKHVIWTKEMDAINKRFQLDLVKEHIRNRLKTWKKQYGILSELLEQSGFGWDETRNMVVADDSAWEDYIKADHGVEILALTPIGRK